MRISDNIIEERQIVKEGCNFKHIALLRDQQDHEPSSKRAKAIRKSVVSLANLISPGKPNQKGKLQRSSSFKESGSAASSSTTTAVYSSKPYRPPTNTPNKSKNNRRSKLWCETFDHTGLNEGEIKWQEAIFELYQGERDLVQDLTMAKQTYRDSMVTLKMLSDEEVALIFGKLGCLLPLHEDLLARLEQARGEDGRTLGVGYIFMDWFPRISTAYRDYCSNQSDAKYALDAAVERDARVRDFLQRCLESPFSRKLDLWSYLDLPRTRLVKYPLLLQNVLKRTPVKLTEERGNLNKVMEIIGEIIERVDETTGEQQCRYIRSKLEYLDEKQKSLFVDNSRLMLCSGQLKNNRGTKMHVFLFEEAFVLTRQATRSNKISYQVYRHPLPMRSLVVDTNEGDKLSGSFRGGILGSEKVKHSFRVRSEELNVSYTLQACEEHDKKQWINAIQDALTKYKMKNPEAVENQTQLSRRRATYDPSKKQAARSVLRTSSDKSNRSVASSTDKSSLQEESQEDDASSTSEDVGPWRRTRSQTVNPAILASKSGSSVSRKSSGSSTKSEKSSDDKKNMKDLDAQKLRNRLKHLESEADGPPSPLRDSFRKKSSLSRHFSLSGADKKPKVVVRTNSDQDEKARNKCQRSRSLTSSPQMVKSVVARFSGKRLSHGKLATSSLAVPNAAKPPIGPTASPHPIRRTPSLKTPNTIHEAQSTPNLTVLRSTSFCTRRSSSTRLAQLVAINSSNSVGNLRKGLAGGSAYDLRSSSMEMRAENAKLIRKSRSGDKAASEGDAQDEIFPRLERPNEELKVVKKDEITETRPLSNRLAAVAIVCTPASPKGSTTSTPPKTTGEVQDIADEVMTITTPVEDVENCENNTEIDATSHNDVTTATTINDDVKVPDFELQPEYSDVTTAATISDDVTPSDDVKVPDTKLLPENSDCSDLEIAIQNQDTACDVSDLSAQDIMTEYSDLEVNEDIRPAQNMEGDLISFDATDPQGSKCEKENEELVGAVPMDESNENGARAGAVAVEEPTYPNGEVEELSEVAEIAYACCAVDSVTPEVQPDNTGADDISDQADQEEAGIQIPVAEYVEMDVDETQDENENSSSQSMERAEDSQDGSETQKEYSPSESEQVEIVVLEDAESMECSEDGARANEVEVVSPYTDNDEGIGHEETAFEVACSDIDNNNVQMSDKALPDTETDEQSCLEIDTESMISCRSGITDEHSNQQPKLQSSA